MIAKENALIFHRILSTYSLKKCRYGDKCGEFMCGVLGPNELRYWIY